jgi:hypothetical protein
MQVVFFPILVLDRTSPGKWRGTIEPRDVNRWWRSYEAFILHYARLAELAGASGLVVGSELGSTESWRDRWFHLLGRVQKVFGGKRIYSANWDHYAQVSFWRRLDVLGISGYFELSDDSDAPVSELRATWQKARARIERELAGRPHALWLTEVGYVSRDGAAVHPWDYTRKTRLDLEEQRRCYQALKETWTNSSALDGIFFWNWFGKGGPQDGGYTPKGKPAEAVLREWYGSDS